MRHRFPLSTAFHIAIAILKHLHLHEGDSIPTRTFSFLSTVLVASYPPHSSTSDTVSALIRAFRSMIISTPVSLFEPTILAIQTGLAVWIEDKNFSLQSDVYNDLVRNFLSYSSPQSLLGALRSLCLSTNHSFSVCNSTHCLRLR